MNSAVFLRLIKACWPDSQAARRLKRLRQSRSLWMMEWYISLFPNRLKRLWHRRCEKLLLIARLLRHEESVQSGMHRFDKSSVGERHDASFPRVKKGEKFWKSLVTSQSRRKALSALFRIYVIPRTVIGWCPCDRQVRERVLCNPSYTYSMT